MSAAALTRRGLLRAGAGATAGMGAVAVAGCGGDKRESVPPLGRPVAPFDPAVLQRFGDGDTGILNYALYLEHVESAMYARVTGSGLLRRGEASLLRGIAADERRHVETLTALVRRLGGRPVSAPATRFAFAGREQMLDLVASVEGLGAAAYLGQLSRIQDRKVMAAALAIQTVEGAHAAALNTVVGRTITPDGSLANPASGRDVLAAIGEYVGG